MSRIGSRWSVVLVVALVMLPSLRALGEADGPDFYDVTGVTPGSVLNVRAEADRAAARIGTIPADGTCIRNLGCVGGLTLEEFTTLSETERRAVAGRRPRWCKVEYGGVTGWAAGRYLREAAGPCAGKSAGP